MSLVVATWTYTGLTAVIALGAARAWQLERRRSAQEAYDRKTSQARRAAAWYSELDEPDPVTGEAVGPGPWLIIHNASDLPIEAVQARVFSRAAYLSDDFDPNDDYKYNVNTAEQPIIAPRSAQRYPARKFEGLDQRPTVRLRFTDHNLVRWERFHRELVEIDESGSPKGRVRTRLRPRR